jgi:MFS family permease
MQSKSPLYYGYFIVAAATIILVVGFGTLYSYSVFFNDLLNEFHWSRAVTSGAFSMSTLLSGLVGILLGHVSDRFGPKMICIFSAICLALGYFLMFFVNEPWQVYLIYGILLAAGVGGLWPSLLSTLARWFTEKRGLMTGIVTAGVGIGTVIFPPLLSSIILATNWRTTYAITGLIVLVFMIGSALFLKSKPDFKPAARPVDNSKFSTSSISQRLFTFKQAVSTHQFWILTLLSFLIGYSQFTITVHLVPFATGMGISPVTAASILGVVGFASIFGRLLVGAVADKISSRRLFMLITFFFFASFVLLEFSNQIWSLYLFAIVFGVCYGGSSTIQPLIGVELFGLSSLGTIMACFLFSVGAGGACGPIFSGFIFDVTGSYQFSFLVCVGATLIAFVFTFLLTPPKIPDSHS